MLPARPTPSRAVPRLPVDPGPIPPGNGRVLIDSDDGQVEVLELIARKRIETSALFRQKDEPMSEQVRPLCTTPCAIDLPYGTHHLLFQQALTDKEVTKDWEADVSFSEHPGVYRVTLQEKKIPKLKKTGEIVTIVGSSIVAVGGTLAAADRDVGTPSSDGLLTASIATATLGLGMVIVGLVVENQNRGYIRPGSDTQFAMPKPELLPAPAPIVTKSRTRTTGRERAAK